jgi:seryl-tRNA synthetase
VTWRHMIALLENGQREDGSVVLPAALTAFGAPASLPPRAPR